MSNMITLPAVYGLYLLTLMRDRGHDPDSLLAGTGLDATRLGEQSERISGAQYATLLVNAVRISADPGLCYELGLRSPLTKHGFVGFGLMSCANLRDAIDLGQRYLHARVPLFDTRVSIEDAQVVVDLQPRVDLGPAREFTLSLVVIELCCLFSRLISDHKPPASWRSEIHLPFPEPAHHAAWRDRLPPMRFNRASTQIRFPEALLDQPIATANPVAAQMAIAQCDQELASLQSGSGLHDQVCRQLVCQDGRYPDLATVARQLCLSERTLKRRLQLEGLGFQTLLDQVRERDSKRLLARPQLSVDQVAEAVGYRDPANFTRAFRKWTGISPRAWRQQPDLAEYRDTGPK